MNNSGKITLTKILGLFAITGFVLTGLLAFFLFQGSGSGSAVDVVIPNGASLYQVAGLLEEKKVIAQPTFFRYLIRVTQGQQYVRAGEFRFYENMRPLSALRTLYFAKPLVHQVTIPEGWTIKQIAEILREKNLGDPARFAEIALSKETAKKYNLKTPSMEGFLFPDTYGFSRSDSEEKMVEAMFKRFEQKYSRYKKEASLKGYSKEWLVNLASIVEKETGAAQERPRIASVFLNRLKKGMRLQSDPTTIYGIKNFDGNLTRRHLRTRTPYNTYKIKGLPKGPIANPGESAIIAVLRPERTDYLYFVSNNNGTHVFSKTYKEHEKHVNYLQKGWGRRPTKR